MKGRILRTCHENVPKIHNNFVPRLKRELECPKSITWLGGWEPDNKYVKPIVLKNTTLRYRVIKFCYELTKEVKIVR